jgi:hypothetical protein
MHADGFEYEATILKRQVGALVYFMRKRFGMTVEAAQDAALDLIKSRFLDAAYAPPKATSDEDLDTLTIAEVLEKLKEKNRKAKVVIHLTDMGRGRVVEGVLPDAPPEFGIGDDFLNVVFLYGRVTDEYDEPAAPLASCETPVSE